MELKELALRIRRGDREALKTLISEYGVSVYQKAYQKTQDKVLAREATRQTFAQLVTALQEQTDMDGWELWLNALAKRNIETYSNIGADMAYLENQLDRELFAPAAQPAQPPLPDAASQLAMRRQYEAQQAQLRAQQQYEAQQAQLRLQQYEALMAQQPAVQQPAAQPQPVAQPQAAAQPPEAPPTPAAKALPDLPEAHATGPAKGHKRHKGGREAKPSRPGSAWPVIVLLALLCAVLVWLVLGVVMSFGWLPKLDIGYEWFNAHILDLF